GTKRYRVLLVLCFNRSSTIQGSTADQSAMHADDFRLLDGIHPAIPPDWSRIFTSCVGIGPDCGGKYRPDSSGQNSLSVLRWQLLIRFQWARVSDRSAATVS